MCSEMHSGGLDPECIFVITVSTCRKAYNVRRVFASLLYTYRSERYLFPQSVH